MAPSIYARIHSGLGNQLFEYAAARAVSLRLRLPLVLDLSWFYRKRLVGTPRQNGLAVFSLPTRAATGRELQDLANASLIRRFGLVPVAELVTFVDDTFRGYMPHLARLNGPAYLNGLWQSPRYFEQYAVHIRNDLKFPPLGSEAARALAAQITGTPVSVSVHVRRGDFISKPHEAARRPACCPPEYYRRAIDLLVQRCGPLTLFLFSDDPDWVRSSFDPAGQKMVVVDVPGHVEAPQHDLHLMSLARHHVIANSTFSWWGAWLAAPRGQSVIAPSRWFIDDPESGKDRFPSSWTTLSAAGEEVPLRFS